MMIVTLRTVLSRYRNWRSALRVANERKAPFLKVAGQISAKKLRCAAELSELELVSNTVKRSALER